MAISRSPHQYLERRGTIRTSRLPRPTLDLARLKILDLPLYPPYPGTQYRLDQAGSPPPDRGETHIWPPTE